MARSFHDCYATSYRCQIGKLEKLSFQKSHEWKIPHKLMNNMFGKTMENRQSGEEESERTIAICRRRTSSNEPSTTVVEGLGQL